MTEGRLFRDWKQTQLKEARTATYRTKTLPNTTTDLRPRSATSAHPNVVYSR